MAVSQAGPQERHHRARRRPAPHPSCRRGLHLPEPPGVRGRPGVRPASARPEQRPSSAGDQAGRLLAAPGAAQLRAGHATGRHRGPDHVNRRVRPAWLGSRRSRPQLVLHRCDRGPYRHRTALRRVWTRVARADGSTGVRRPGQHVRAGDNGADRDPPRRPLAVMIGRWPRTTFVL